MHRIGDGQRVVGFADRAFNYRESDRIASDHRSVERAHGKAVHLTDYVVSVNARYSSRARRATGPASRVRSS